MQNITKLKDIHTWLKPKPALCYLWMKSRMYSMLTCANWYFSWYVVTMCQHCEDIEFYTGVKVNGYVRNSILPYYLGCMCYVYFSRCHTNFLYALNTQMTYYNCTLCWVPYPTMQCIDLTFHFQCDVWSNCDDSFDHSHKILFFFFLLKSECLIPIFIHKVTEVMLKKLFHFAYFHIHKI